MACETPPLLAVAVLASGIYGEFLSCHAGLSFLSPSNNTLIFSKETEKRKAILNGYKIMEHYKSKRVTLRGLVFQDCYRFHPIHFTVSFLASFICLTSVGGKVKLFHSMRVYGQRRYLKIAYRILNQPKADVLKA